MLLLSRPARLGAWQPLSDFPFSCLTQTRRGELPELMGWEEAEQGKPFQY